MKLVPTRIDTVRKESEFFNQHFPAVLEYNRLREAGVGEKEALKKASLANETTGKRAFACDPSNFHKTRRYVRAYLAWLRGS